MRDKILAFDMDDVICIRPKNYEHLGVEKYRYCEPVPEMIDVINECHKTNKIVIYTARGMNQFNGDKERVYTKLFNLTYEQLTNWGVQFDELIMGKIHYDLMVDDKAINSQDVKTMEDLQLWLGY